MKIYYTTILIIFLQLSFVFNSNAQWEDANGKIMNIRSFGFKDSLIFVGGKGIIYRSSNFGLSWIENSGFPQSAYINNIVTKGEKIFASSGNKIFFTLDYGENWSSLNYDFRAPITTLITIKDDVFAGTYGSGIFHSSDDGSTWQSSNSGIENLKIRNLIIAGEDVFAGTEGGIYHSTNNGDEWIQVYNKFVWSISICSGTIFAYNNESINIYSSDKGATWNDFGKSGSFIVTGDILFCRNNGIWERSLDCGKTWETLGVFYYTPVAKYGTNIFGWRPPSLAPMFGGSGTPGISYNNGLTWRDMCSYLGNFRIYSLESDQKNVYIYASNETLKIESLLVSTDNGLHWSDINPLNNNKINSFVVSDSVIYISQDEGLYFSSNFGVTWDTLGLQNGNFYKEDSCIFLMGSKNYISINSGKSWKQFNTPNLISITGISFHNNYLFIVGSTSDNQNLILRSSNRGFSWENASTGLPTLAPYQKLINIGPFLFASANALYRTSDNGNSWEELDRDITISCYPNGISKSSDVLFITNQKLQNYYTTDFGKSWIHFNYGAITSTTNGNYLFSGTNMSYGLKRTKVPSLVTHILQDELSLINNSFYLSQNYPNPFNPTTTIKFKIPEEGYISLKVYDLLGKEIATLVNEQKPAGEYVAEFNASSLSNGVYLYRLQTGSCTETKKLMLMK